MDVNYGLREGSRWSKVRNPKPSEFLQNLGVSLGEEGFIFARSYSNHNILDPKVIYIGVRERDIDSKESSLKPVLDRFLTADDILLADWHNGFEWRGRKFCFPHLVPEYTGRVKAAAVIDDEDLIAKQELSRERGLDLNDYYTSERGRKFQSPLFKHTIKHMGSSSGRLWWLVSIDHLVHKRLENYIAEAIEHAGLDSVAIVPKTIDGSQSDNDEYMRLTRKFSVSLPSTSWLETPEPTILRPSQVLDNLGQSIDLYTGFRNSIWSEMEITDSSPYVNRMIESARNAGFILVRSNSRTNVLDPDVVCLAVDETFTHDYQQSDICRSNSQRLLGFLRSLVETDDLVLYDEGGTFGGRKDAELVTDLPKRIFNVLESFPKGRRVHIGTERYMIGLDAIRHGEKPIGRLLDFHNGTEDMIRRFFETYYKHTKWVSVSSGAPRTYLVVWHGHVINDEWRNPIAKTLEAHKINYVMLVPDSLEYRGISKQHYEALVRKASLLPPTDSFAMASGYFRK